MCTGFVQHMLFSISCVLEGGLGGHWCIIVFWNYDEETVGLNLDSVADTLACC